MKVSSQLYLRIVYMLKDQFSTNYIFTALTQASVSPFLKLKLEPL
jgi:hypothetical protein